MINPTHAQAPRDLGGLLIYLTPGRKYKILSRTLNDRGGIWVFVIRDDDGEDLMCLAKNCAHILGRNWVFLNENA